MKTNFQQVITNHMHAQVLFASNYDPTKSVGYSILHSGTKDAIGDFVFHKAAWRGSMKETVLRAIEELYNDEYKQYSDELETSDLDTLLDFVGCVILSSAINDYNECAARVGAWQF